MRVFKLIGALAMVLALTGISAAAASAEVGFLPGKDKTPFTNLSGKAILTTVTPKEKLKLQIEATKCKSTGELVNPKALDPATEALLVIDCEGSKSLGLSINSVGDPKEIILIHVEAKSCTISTAPLVGGILLLPLPVKLEVPAVKLTIEVTGDVIGRLLPENKKAELFALDLNAPSGVQEFKDCKDGVTGALLTEELKAKVDAEAAAPATEEAKEGLLQFTVANAQTWDT